MRRVGEAVRTSQIDACGGGRPVSSTMMHTQRNKRPNIEVDARGEFAAGVTQREFAFRRSELRFDGPQKQRNSRAGRHDNVARGALHGVAAVEGFEGQIFRVAVDDEDRDIEGARRSGYKTILGSAAPGQRAIRETGRPVPPVSSRTACSPPKPTRPPTTRWCSPTRGEIVSGGNFHGAPVALAADLLCIGARAARERAAARGFGPSIRR